MSEQTHNHCPFCGGAPKLLNMGHLSWHVGCPACGCTTGDYGTESDAWAAWDRRADPAWVKASEAVPTDELPVLLLRRHKSFPHLPAFRDYGHYDGRAWRSDVMRCFCNDVEYWMPLPEVPAPAGGKEGTKGVGQ